MHPKRYPDDEEHAIELEPWLLCTMNPRAHIDWAERIVAFFALEDAPKQETTPAEEDGRALAQFLNALRAGSIFIDPVQQAALGSAWVVARLGR